MTEELDDFLKHYGVKGMKWGVRKKDPDGLSRNERRKIEREAHKKLPKEVKRWVTDADVLFKTKKGRLYAASLKRQIEADIAAQKKNQKQFLAKGGFTEADIKPEKKPGWKPTPEEIAWMAVGAGFIALVAYAAVENHRLNKITAGQKISSTDYNSKVLNSKMKTWKSSDSYFTKEAMAREEFSIPAGTTFNRISRKAEDSFRKNSATYATHSTEDFNRYVNSFRQELGPVKLHHVKFEAKQPIRVSSYKTNARAMAMAMEGRVSSVAPVTLERGAQRFRSQSGGNWSTQYMNGELSTNGNFFDILKHKGYGAIVDEMDAGVIGQTPVVVFANEMFGTKSSSELTPAMIEAAQNALTEIAGRK